MFDDQAVNFLALLEKKTLNGKANWLRYPKAYPYQDNNFLKLHLSKKKSLIDKSASYFMPCKNGTIFLFSYTDSRDKAEICVQQNFGVPLLALEPGPTTDRIAVAIHNYLETSEFQPDSVYQFFRDAVDGTPPLTDEERASASY